MGSKFLNAGCKKNDASPVRATDERLIAPRYLMQISAYLAFSCTKFVLYVR